MSKVIKDPITLIVRDGVPYSLVRLDPTDGFSPCAVCDLRDDCNADGIGMRFVHLCSPDDIGEAFFFQEDWGAVKKQVIDYTHFSIDQVDEV